MDMNSFNGLLNTPDTTDSFDADDIATNKNYAILACLAVLFWIPLVAAKNSAFAKYYANQGAILLILFLIAGIVGFVPFIGGLFRILLGIIGIAEMLFLLVNANNGRAKEMPVIGGLIQIIT